MHHHAIPRLLHHVRFVFLSLFLALPLSVVGYGYDPDADPAATYQQALSQSPLAETIEGSFVVTHVDIGNWDRNMAFTEQFGKPVAKGIPSIAIVAPDGQVLYVSEAGEFASARSAELAALNAWFSDITAKLGDP